MSCWVVPSLAAEFWGISVEQVMANIANGSLRTSEEHGFVTVDVAPESPRLEQAQKPVYPPVKPKHESQLPEAVEEFTETIEKDVFGDWRTARAKASQLRKPPEPRPLN